MCGRIAFADIDLQANTILIKKPGTSSHPAKQFSRNATVALPWLSAAATTCTITNPKMPATRLAGSSL